MTLTIHRGTHEIGGTCVVLMATNGERLVLDLGRPLADDTGTMLPSVPGLFAHDAPGVLGVVVSHAHQDHTGFLGRVHPQVPVYASPGTIALLGVSAVFLPDARLPRRLRSLPYDSPLDIGPFRVTATVVDHSAPDAVSLLIEADGQRLLYSGDLRAHGRKGALFDRMLAHPPPNLDAVLLEGTMVGQPGRGLASETEVEGALIRRFRAQENLTVVFCSSQNLDRVVSIYRAALRSDRSLVVDLYTAFVLRELHFLSDRLPWVGSKHLYTFFWHRHATVLADAGHTKFLYECRRHRLTASELVARRADMVFLARTSVFEPLLNKLPDLAGMQFIWSLWRGYLTKDSPVARYAARHTIPVQHVHCGGHATVADVRRLAQALAPGRLVPVHTEHPGQFVGFPANVLVAHDGETIDLAACTVR